MRYGTYDLTRGLTIAICAGVAGVALWGATQVGVQTTGRFWLAMAIVAAAGLLLALALHVGTGAKGLRLRLSPGTFVLGFLPVLICVAWILIATQPGHGWEEGRISSWSSSIGILGLVHSLGLWHGVLAFAFGVVLGFSFDGVPEPMLGTEPAYGASRAAAGPPVADEPVAAERRWTARRGTTTRTDPAAPPVDETARTREQTPVQ